MVQKKKPSRHGIGRWETVTICHQLNGQRNLYLRFTKDGTGANAVKEFIQVRNTVRIAVQDWSGMSDLIDRQTIIDLLTSRAETLRGLYGDLGGAASGVRKLVQTLPSAEPERKWIPVTEALPEEKKYVLVTTIDDDMKVSWVTDVNYWWNIGRGKVIAWMPLPEPWRGDR